MLATVVASVTTILTFAGIFYYIAVLWSARSFIRRQTSPLKPTEGLNGALSPTQANTRLEWATGTEGLSGAQSFAPGVSILKPVKGLDPGMYEAFASHCWQEYVGEYEILFGVSSLNDPTEAPVIEAIERLKAEFPEQTIRLNVRSAPAARSACL